MPFFGIILVCLFIALPQTVQANSYRLVTAVFKPFTDPDNEKGGFLSEVVRQALATQGHEVSIDFRPWPRAMAAAENGRYDGLLSAFYNTERGQKFYFSAPINTTKMVLIGMRNAIFKTRYASLDDLRPYTIAVGRKWAYSEEFEADKNLNKVMVANEANGIKLLFNRRVDLFAVNADQFQRTINGMPDFNIDETVTLSPTISTNDQHIAAPRGLEGSAQFLAEFNTGLAAIKANGTYDKIRTEFFGF